MSAVVDIGTAEPHRCASSRPVARSAGYVTSRGEPLFTWLHMPRDERCVDHAVLICGPVGHEQLHAHRTLRYLADAIARHGMPTVRFDWHGTGDSAGMDEDPQRGATWRSNVIDMLRWMRRELRCQSVSVVGVRLGALLAAEALGNNEIGNEEIDNLILLDPVISGRSYVREMTMIDRAGAGAEAKTTSGPRGIEAAGFVVTRELANELSQSNLLSSYPRCRRVLVVDRDDARPDDRLRDQFSQLGIAVEHTRAPGLPAMLVEPHLGQVPWQAIEQISQWLADRARSDALCEHRPVAMPDCAELRGPAECPIRERAWRISGAPDLFGIISEPATFDARKPTIVLLNAGATHHVGPGRLHVHLARALAREGFRCLRLDLCGLGDSVADDRAVENNSYASTALRDVAIALEQSQVQLGTERHVLVGLCSGAYAAFQAAAQIVDPTLIESVLINPLTFYWKDGMVIDADPARHLRDQHRWMSAVRRPSKWIKFLAGQTNIGWRDALGLLRDRRRLRNRTKAMPLAEPAQRAASYPSHPIEDDLAGDLGRIVERKRRLAMFFSKDDPGYTILNFYAAKRARKLVQSGRLRMEFIAGADHTFSRRGPRGELIDRLTAYLGERFPTT